MRNGRFKQFKKMGSEKIIIIAIIISILSALTITALGMAFYKISIKDTGLVTSESYTNYEKHYVLITEHPKTPFWNSVYNGALEKGKSLGIYVENFGSNLTQSYSVNELLEMAIAAKVDGIIVEASADEQTTLLINQAVAADIPVVTALGDNMQSNRQCFIGINNYNLGKEYGNQVLSFADKTTESVMVLLDSNNPDTSQNIILSGIQETLSKSNIKVKTVSTDKESTFSSEEAIRNIIIDSKHLPDALICLNSVDTICAYQAVVDFNKVGEINILGYYNEESVLSAIQKNIIYSTIVINTAQMGAFCVESLSEYQNTNRISEYISVDINLVSKENIDNYLLQ